VPTVKVRLLGEEMTIQGDAEPERLERLAAELEVALQKILNEAGLRGQPTKVALLAALNYMEELEKVRGEFDKLKREHDSLIGQMVRRIDYALKQDPPGET